jgi:hypothetical protein
MDNENIIEEEDLKKNIKFKETCCKSYLTPKGRCYTCPFNNDKDPDYEDDY